MTYHARLNLIMLVTLTSLAIFLYVKPQSQNNQGYRLSALTADTVQHIRIVHQDTSIVLKKTGNRWYLTEPLHASADETKIEKLLEILTATSSHRFPLDDATRFSLDNTDVQLDIDRASFKFGGITPITNEQYVAAGESVYLISPRYAVMLPSQPVTLVSPTLLAETEVPVRFDLVDFSINQLDGEWIISPEVCEQLLSADEITRWVQLWQLAVADHIFSNTDKLDANETNAEHKEIKIMLQDGQSIHFNIQQNDPELILTRVDEEISYTFTDDLGKQLLNPFYAELKRALP